MSSGRGASGPLLDRTRIRDLLVELGAELDAKGIEARVFLVGGAAMALAFARDRVTRDLDAVFEPKQAVYDAAARVARRHRLPETWLNDAVQGLLPDRQPPTEGTASFSAPGIKVGVASAEYLFAMKAMAARQETDGDDLRRLAADLGLGSVQDAMNLVERFYGPARLGPKTGLILESLFDAPTD